MSDFPAGVTLGLLPPREAERAEPRFVAAPITAQYAVAPEHYLMRLREAAIARGVPGQFVMVNPWLL
jgi:NAD(P)H-flavin reductase